ncbi:hypothetical protein GR328_23535 [Microvirga makkahensis]|uniref:LysR substrate-binding domain-containing protein n=2 Tax=Microvirga makkahensis TaxID=1128670 RepID=A0A7X3MW75_9HYPH|nr:hypothetical protein [Microvirga makkahensis]
MAPLLPVIGSFAETYPAVDLRVIVDAVTSPLASVLEGTSMLGITGPLALQHQEIVTAPILTVQRVAVAAPSHPLARSNQPLTRRAITEHRQIVTWTRDQTGGSHPFRPTSTRAWQASDIGAKREMLLAGLGWGTMPLHIVEDDLASGRLVQLRLPPQIAAPWSTPLPLYLIRSVHHPQGPAGRWLFERIVSILGQH